MDIKYFIVQERVRNKEVSMVNISAHMMITDPLTKGLPPTSLKNMLLQWELLSHLIYSVSNTMHFSDACFVPRDH